MEKAMIRKIIIVVSLLVLTIVLALGCNYLTRDDDNPMIDNADDSFLSLGNINISRGEVYERTKSLEGINHLLNYIDEELLEDYIDSVDNSEVDEELNRIKYGTTDPIEIAEIQADEAQMEEIEEQFYYTVAYAGFDPDKPEEIDRFIRLNIAKKLATKERLLVDFQEDEDEFEDNLLEFYEENYYGDVTAIELVFQNEDEFNAVMDHFDLVPNYEGGLGLYDGDVPIEDLSREDLTDDNTRVLEDDEVFEMYVLIYNYLYQYRNQLPEDVEETSLNTFSTDFFKFTYEDMTESARTSKAAEILFDELSLDEDDEDAINYTIDKRRYNEEDSITEDYYVMYYKIHQESIDTYDDLTDDAKARVREEYLDTLASEELVNSYVIELRDENNIVFHDSQLHKSYEQMVANVVGPEYAVYENLDNQLLVTLDDFTVSTEAFFEYALRRTGALTVIQMYKEAYLLESQYFTSAFGDNRDLINSRNDNLEEHREFIENLKLQFSQHEYSQVYSWEEFLYLFYGHRNDVDFMRQLVVSELQNYLIPDHIDYDDAHDYVTEQYDNYINMRVEHILVFVDFDGDLEPDDYESFLDGLSDADQTAYTLKKAALETALIEAAEDLGSLSEVVDEYNEALRDESDEDNPWAEFKNYGFKVRHENLSSEGQGITYNQTKTFVENFTTNLYRIYETYLTNEYNEEDNLLDDRIFTTEFGMHLVKARKAADNFEAPSAEFTDTENAYDDRVENTNAIPSKDQIELWVEANFELLSSGDTDIELPDEVDNALSVYFESYFNGLLPNPQENFDPFGNLVMIDQLLDGNATFSEEDDRIQVMLNALKEVYQMIIFGD
ncbi:MAG: hypothetical protein ACOCU2_01900 [Bacillota bacterium]